MRSYDGKILIWNTVKVLVSESGFWGMAEKGEADRMRRFGEAKAFLKGEKEGREYRN